MTHGTITGGEGDASFAADLGPGLGRTHTRSVALFGPDDPLVLDNGRRLSPVEVAYETYGTLDPDGGNAVVVCHALTGDAHAAGHHGDPGRRGWWDVLIGPGRAIDTDHRFVVCANLLGGCSGTTGPSTVDPDTGRPRGLGFPALTIADLVRVQRALLRRLGVSRVRLAIGGSLGGMQVLEWLLQAPHEVERAAILCASARLSAQNIALSTAAREGILRDPDFQGGDYVGTGRIPAAGLAAARMLGHVTYVTEDALTAKFDRRLRDGGRPRIPSDGREWFAPEFEVEHYLAHQAESFLGRFDALSYLWLTKVMDAFAPFERPGLDGRLAAVRDAGTKVLVETFSSDWRFGPEHGDRIATTLSGAGVPVRREDLASPWGHDSFLLPLREHLELIAAFDGG